MDRAALEREGFLGFQTVKELRVSGIDGIPNKPGVYAVLRTQDTEPHFLPQSPAGRWKGRDPTVPVETLRKHWVPDASVLYFGKAGGTRTVSTLRGRVGAYLCFGGGAEVGHWGGRFIWQLRDSSQLTLCWKPVPGTEPRDAEVKLLQRFKQQHGRLPFANLRL